MDENVLQINVNLRPDLIGCFGEEATVLPDHHASVLPSHDIKQTVQNVLGLTDDNDVRILFAGEAMWGTFEENGIEDEARLTVQYTIGARRWAQILALWHDMSRSVVLGLHRRRTRFEASRGFEQQQQLLLMRVTELYKRFAKHLFQKAALAMQRQRAREEEGYLLWHGTATLLKRRALEVYVEAYWQKQAELAAAKPKPYPSKYNEVGTNLCLRKVDFGSPPDSVVRDAVARVRGHGGKAVTTLKAWHEAGKDWEAWKITHGPVARCTAPPEGHEALLFEALEQDLASVTSELEGGR